MAKQKANVSVRPLTADDLDATVAIDAGLSGHPRRDFFERRLKAALKDPKSFIYVGAYVGGELKGYALVRLVDGEFGHDRSGMLDAIGVDPAHGRAGLGDAMLAEIDTVMRHKEIAELQSEADWRNTGLLGFLSHAGFEHAPRLVLKRDVASDLDW